MEWVALLDGQRDASVVAPPFLPHKLAEGPLEGEVEALSVDVIPLPSLSPRNAANTLLVAVEMVFPASFRRFGETGITATAVVEALAAEALATEALAAEVLATEALAVDGSYKFLDNVISGEPVSHGEQAVLLAQQPVKLAQRGLVRAHMLYDVQRVPLLGLRLELEHGNGDLTLGLQSKPCQPGIASKGSSQVLTSVADHLLEVLWLLVPYEVRDCLSVVCLGYVCAVARQIGRP